ncbi:aAA domain / AAA domain multi-domain protein [Prevotella sp. CAG:1320]|nr:aAA domain / AAA domain multi-domain protein [Prevotella sp. CAG:1320]
MRQQETALEQLCRQKLLLQLEYYTEKEAFRKQTETMGLRRKVKRGDAWFPIRVGKSYYNSLNQLVVEVFRGEEEDVDHNFEFGRPVVFLSATDAKDLGGKLRYFSFTATVSYVDGNRMVVAVPDSAPLLELQSSSQPLGVQLSFDETSYRAMFQALDRVIAAKNDRLAYLRELFHGDRQPQRYAFEPIRFPWLNPTQEQAVNEVLRAKDVAIVHGPPGTGKTTTLVEAINETLMRESQVMVCAQSNMAVDWISEKLVDRGINVLRIGNPTRVNDKMLGFTYERRFESHPDYPQLWAIRKAIRELRQHRKRGSDSFHQKMERLKSRATELELRINAQLFGEARVIACTLVGSANKLLDGQRFNTLFIDEAAQALEAACWIPLRRVSRVILAGDHCQLPPTVKSLAALKAGLGVTLMERVTATQPSVVTLLKVQYRMNEAIMRFSSDWFYGGQVKSAPQVKHRGILDYDNPFLWIDTAPLEEEDDSPVYHEQFVGESFGRVNKAEANLTISTLRDYLEKVGKQRFLDEQVDVGVISPYRAQVQYLRSLIKATPELKPFRRAITVNTVDGFQGQERDIVLISLVRSNAAGDIGFLKDLRRMNVAITRARMKVIILGDVKTLTRHPFYKRLWDYVERARQRYQGDEEESLDNDTSLEGR